METKKTKTADLENKRLLFLEIGGVTALLLTIMLFAWGVNEKTITLIAYDPLTVIEEKTVVTTHEEKLPEIVSKPLNVAGSIINIVDNNKKIAPFDFSSEFTGDEPIVMAPARPKEAPAVDDTPFITAEKMPEFEGGSLEKFRAWVSAKVVYPQAASDNNIEGKVHVSFVIERNGALTNITIVASPDRSLSEEAARVLESSPKWTPGEQRGKAVRVQYNMAVDFRLQK